MLFVEQKLVAQQISRVSARLVEPLFHELQGSLACFSSLLVGKALFLAFLLAVLAALGTELVEMFHRPLFAACFLGVEGFGFATRAGRTTQGRAFSLGTGLAARFFALARLFGGLGGFLLPAFPATFPFRLGFAALALFLLGGLLPFSRAFFLLTLGTFVRLSFPGRLGSGAAFSCLLLLFSATLFFLLLSRLASR